MAAVTPGHVSAAPLHDKASNMSGVMSYLEARLTYSSSLSRDDFVMPIIDLSKSFSGTINDRKAVAAQIRKACTTSGFFYITNHNVPQPVCAAALRQAERIFRELPQEKKAALHMRNSDLHRGWEPSEFTSMHGAVETKEAFNWGWEPALDDCGNDGKYVELDGDARDNANLWPSEEDLPGFFAAIKEYYGGMLELTKHMFKLFALALDLPEDHFDNVTTHLGAISRLIYYPASVGYGAPKNSVGLGAHTDYECFTILLSSAAPGLEILTPENEWLPVAAVPDSFIVNVADFLMRWTNGVFKSTVHRVAGQTSEARYSIPTFCSINYDEVVETLPTCIAPDNPAKYPPIRAGQYVLDRLNDNLTDGTGQYGVSSVEAKT